MTARFSITQLDAVEWLRSLDDESVDLSATDPAYASLEKHRAKGTTTRLKQSDSSSNEWFDVVPNDYFAPFFEEHYRVLKPDSHLYVLCDQETMFAIKPMGEAAGFTWKKALIWEKTNADDSIAIGLGYTWRASHEVICYFEKGKRRLNDLSLPDVIRAPRVRGGYPTEKPVDLLTKLVINSSAPGELVIDPFMGSASCGEAALRSGRDFAGCDISDRSIAAARERLSGLGEPFTLPPRKPRAQGELF